MRTLHDEEAWRDAAQADRARKHRRVDCGSHAGVVAKRLRQTLAHTARRLSLLIRAGADPGDDGRGAGSVYLRDLLTEDDFRELLACPACANPLAADWSCRGCAARFEAPDGIPNLRLPSDRRTDAVRRFYERAPFPGYPPRDSLPALHARAERSVFACLVDQAIAGDARIVEIGCGTGQMCLYLARGDRMVIGADLVRAALRAGAAGGVAARPVSTSRGTLLHARPGAGLVCRESRRVPAGLPERGAGRGTGGVVRARVRQLAGRGLAGATGLDSRARARGRVVL